MSQKTITLDTVYSCLTGESRNTLQTESTAPTFEVVGSGATINICVSNKEVEPTSKTEMTLDSGSPFAEDMHLFNGQCKYVYFEMAAGSPIVQTCNIVEG